MNFITKTDLRTVQELVIKLKVSTSPIVAKACVVRITPF